MAVAQMKKIQIFALRNDLNKLLKILQNLSVVELTRFSHDQAGLEIDSSVLEEEIQRQLSECDLALAEIGKSLGFLDQIAPLKASLVEQFAGVKTFLTPVEQEELLTKESQCLTLQAELQQIESELNRIQAERTKLQAQISVFTPWLELKLPYEALKGTTAVQMLLIEAEADASQLELALNETEIPYYFERCSISNLSTRGLLIIFREAYETVQAILNKENVTTVSLPPYDNSVKLQVEAWQQQLLQLDAETTDLKNQVIEKNKERSLLQVFYDKYLSDKTRITSNRQLVYSNNCIGLSGWIEADKFSNLEEKLTNSKLEYVLQEVLPEADEVIPTILKNNKLITPFEYLIESFSYPTYNEVDPTAAVAPFFFIFFGIALGDAAYGLLLAVICGVLLWKLKMGPTGIKISWLFLFSGIASIIVGLLTGSFFSLPVSFGVFSPIERPIEFLGIALGLGLIQLYLGVAISAWGSLKEGRWLDALLDQGFWLMFLTSVLLSLVKGSLGLSDWVYQLLGISAVGLIINNVRSKEGWLKRLLAIPGTFFTFYGSIGFFSDVLSFSRLMALGLSGGVMGSIMNQLAWMMVESIPILGWIIGALIFIGGHLLNIGLCVLGAYVHSSRLQYLEFFGRFFEGGGRPFMPLQNKQKYTFLVNKREAN